MRPAKSMTAPRRRWFRLSLRSLFAAVTLIACWLGYSTNWIRQRHQLMANVGVVTSEPGVAPMGLWLLGEQGFGSIDCLMESDVNAFRKLFPEAEVRHFRGCILGFSRDRSPPAG